MTSLLGSFSGHPLVDYGRAVITAFADRDEPEMVTKEDLERFAAFVIRYYDTDLLQKAFTVLWTTNWPINFSKLPKPYTSAQRRSVGDPEVRKAIMAATMSPAQSGGHCAFCSKTASQRLARERIPLLMGREPVNFGARGAAGGILVCSQCTTAIMGLSLAPMCSGKIVATLADQPSATVEIARIAVKQIRYRATLVDAAKAPPPLKHIRSRVFEYLLQLQGENLLVGGVTVYAFSNSGQKATLELYRLPAGVPRFLLRAGQVGSEHAWRAFRGFVESRAAQCAPEERYYEGFELFFSLPEGANKLSNKFFLPFCRHITTSGDISSRQQLWRLITLFCQEVLMMDVERLDAIRRLGDTLADLSELDQTIPKRALMAGTYKDVRTLLLDVGRRWAPRHGRPVISFEDAITIFESDDRPSALAWRLAWDFVLIRVLERMLQKPNVLTTITEEDFPLESAAEEAEIA